MFKLIKKFFSPESKTARKQKRATKKVVRKQKRKTRKVKRGTKIIQSALSPEELANIKERMQQGKIKVLKTTKEEGRQLITPTKPGTPKTDFWNDKIDLGFIAPTGKELVGGAVGAALLYKIIKK
jgi:hypothetical protein